MHRALLFAPAFLLAVAAAAACGGSSSETPWPVEPEALQQPPSGPVQETMTPSILTEEARDAGRPKKP
jgi:hypothetical protein